jgi:lipopolysaccharide transport system ATP-binding protein
LITDEILAVGDESFQKKCIRWLEQFMTQGGTLLLVSHSMHIVQKLCQKALWIHNGRVKQYGDVSPVTRAYLDLHEIHTANDTQKRLNAPGDDGYYRIEKFATVSEQADVPPCFVRGNAINLELQIYSPDDRVPVGVVGIVGADGTPVYCVISHDEGISPVKLADHYYRFRLRFSDIQLLPGSYDLRGHSMDPEGLRMFDFSKITFSVTGKTKETGFIQLSHEWS